MDFVSICGQSFFDTPISGGEVLNFELLKRISNQKKTYLLINDITLPYAKNNLQCEIISIKDFLNLNVLVRKHLFLVPLAFLNSILKINKILSSFSKDLILYSSGDFICNVLPAVIYKNRFPKSKIVVRIHHLNDNPLKRKGNSFISSLFSFLLQRTSFFLLKRKANLILLLNNGVKDSLLKMGFPFERLVVIGAGIDFKQIKKTNYVERENKVVFLGRQSKTKGVFDLPKVLPIISKKIPDFKFIIIGAGDKRIVDNLKNDFHKANVLNAVEFKGFIKEKKEIYRIMNEAKVFVLPSYEEGWGIVIFEAIACGLAPVVYDLPVFREIFGDKISLTPPGNFSLLAKNILNFLNNEEKRRAYNLVLNKIVKKYDINLIVKKEINLINYCAASPAPERDRAS